jgi:hypothetical protein
MPDNLNPMSQQELSCNFIQYLSDRTRAAVDLENAEDWLAGALTASAGAGNPAGASLKLSNKAVARVDAAIRLLVESLKDQPVSGQTTFDQVFFEAVQQVERAANPDYETALFTFGRAQKVVNIVLKYCYAWWFCEELSSPRYGDLSWVERWAPYFHIPVDRITLKHLRGIEQYKHLTISGTMLISWKWHLSMSRYCAIQDAVRHLARKSGYMDGLHYEMDQIWLAAGTPEPET